MNRWSQLTLTRRGPPRSRAKRTKPRIEHRTDDTEREPSAADHLLCVRSTGDDDFVALSCERLGKREQRQSVTGLWHTAENDPHQVLPKLSDLSDRIPTGR
jgi:hypothetical protein